MILGSIFFKQMTFELRPEGQEKVINKSAGEMFQAERKASTKALKWEGNRRRWKFLIKNKKKCCKKMP